ncbi:hypothetical protein B0H12DRAFT_1143027 [Mycena haematopus]|nr:hypothetical protein B0H12DRAFT_1143027 [Mycena haematopus]
MLPSTSKAIFIPLRVKAKARCQPENSPQTEIASRIESAPETKENSSPPTSAKATGTASICSSLGPLVQILVKAQAQGSLQNRDDAASRKLAPETKDKSQGASEAASEAASKAASQATLQAALEEALPAALKAALQAALDAALPPTHLLLQFYSPTGDGGLILACRITISH